MFLNSREIGIRRLLTVLSMSGVLLAAFAWQANGQALSVGAAHKGSPQSHTAREWYRYTIRGGEFSVLLPTIPAMTTYELRNDPFSKNRIRHIIAAYSQGVVYAIYVAERKSTLEEYIEESRHSSPDDSKREVKIGSFSGREYTFQDTDIKRVTQYFITTRYFYTFVAYGAALGNPNVGMPKFFDSIKFESNGMDIAMVDGPGIQSSIDPMAEGDAARVVSPREVTRKARVITKPEPTYTEEARKNQETGTVVLRGVLSSAGDVTNLQFVSGLPAGLSEKAMAAARQIRFIPAIKDGHFVSMYIQLEYNFNLY